MEEEEVLPLVEVLSEEDVDLPVAEVLGSARPAVPATETKTPAPTRQVPVHAEDAEEPEYNLELDERESWHPPRGQDLRDILVEFDKNAR